MVTLGGHKLQHVLRIRPVTSLLGHASRSGNKFDVLNHPIKVIKQGFDLDMVVV